MCGCESIYLRNTCRLELLKCFVTEELYPFASNYVLPPSFSISTLCVYMWLFDCVLPGGCSSVMKDLRWSPVIMNLWLLSCLLCLSPYISPPSMLFNANLSHSTLSKYPTSWRFSDWSASNTKSKREPRFMPANRCSDQTLPWFPL